MWVWKTVSLLLACVEDLPACASSRIWLGTFLPFLPALLAQLLVGAAGQEGALEEDLRPHEVFLSLHLLPRCEH